MPIISKRNKIICVAAAVTLCATAREVKSLSELSHGNIGEFVTIQGTSKAYYPPKAENGPYAFVLATGLAEEIRVVGWPDIFEQVTHRDLLATSGTQIRITGEVSEYRGKLELRLHDWEEIIITPVTTGTQQLHYDSNTRETGTTEILSTGTLES